MKYSKILLGVMAILFAFTSCKNDDDVVNAKPITAPLLQNPDGSANYVLQEADKDGTFDTFLWKEAYLGEGLTPTYELQFDLGTGDFSNPKKISDITKNYYSIKNGDMNQMLREMGTTAGVMNSVQCRVVAKADGVEKASIPVSFLVNRWIYQDEIIVIGLYGTTAGAQGFLPMVNEEGTNKWSITALLDAGTFKFKDNSYRQTTYGKDTENAGKLIENGGDSFTTLNKVYKITFDSDAMTYTLVESSFPNQLYIVGGWNGWNNTNDDSSNPIPAMMNNNLDGTYDSFINWTATGGFKMIETIGIWDPQYADSSAEPGKGTLTKGGDNIPVAEAGMMFIQADLAKMTWKVTKTEWGIIGDATPKGWGDQTNFTSFDAVTSTYSFEQDLTKGEIKFRGTSDWAVNFGAIDDAHSSDLVGKGKLGGPNIKIAEAGTYIIKLQLTSNNYNYSIVKK